MKKPDSLRRLLLRAVPQLADHPENLALFVDAGRVAARVGRSLSFEYRYKLNLVAQDFAGDRNALVVPLLAWIAEAQPDLLDKPDAEPFTFEAEILDGDAYDLSIVLELTERVVVEVRPDGSRKIDHVDDAPRDDLDRFAGVCGVGLWRLVLGDEIVAQSLRPQP